MRLLNTTTFKFKHFWGDDVPEYAILSHTWGNSEVTFQDILHGKATPGAGFTKVQNFCALAKHYKLSWAWIDTCCIDQTSSAELSEAINSMYRWYEKSAVCFAYLEDVHGFNHSEEEQTELRRSRWFTRGWTLQELIAPSNVYFCSTDWRILGEKFHRRYQGKAYIRGFRSLLDLLSNITGISSEVLVSPSARKKCSVAQRMSWAALRQTTRPEDMAYCLMGIFDINMPLLYGEGGKKAFTRLQEEILRITEDDTIFMSICSYDYCKCDYHPPLASSPRGFRGLGAVEIGEKEPLFQYRNIQTQMTPKGLRIQLPICPCKLETVEFGKASCSPAYIGILDCTIPGPFLDRSVIVFEKSPDGEWFRMANSVMARLELDKQEVVLKSEGSAILTKATSIQFHELRLETIHIMECTVEYLWQTYHSGANGHMNLIFQSIEQPTGCRIVLRNEHSSSEGNTRFYLSPLYLIKSVKLYVFVDEANGDSFVGILGAHKDRRCRKEDQSVPYCKIFERPDVELRDLGNREMLEVMYPDKDPDSLQSPPFSQPPSPQRATLSLSGSREAVVTVESKRFLDREEHCLKLKIQERPL